MIRHGVGSGANNALAGDFGGCESVRLDLGMVNNHLHERELPYERVTFIVDVLNRSEKHVELLELVPSCDPSLHRDVKVVNGPAPQILHSPVSV